MEHKLSGSCKACLTGRCGVDGEEHQSSNLPVATYSMQLIGENKHHLHLLIRVRHFVVWKSGGTGVVIRELIWCGGVAWCGPRHESHASSCDANAERKRG